MNRVLSWESPTSPWEVKLSLKFLFLKQHHKCRSLSNFSLVFQSMKSLSQTLAYKNESNVCLIPSLVLKVGLPSSCIQVTWTKMRTPINPNHFMVFPPSREMYCHQVKKDPPTHGWDQSLWLSMLEDEEFFFMLQTIPLWTFTFRIWMVPLTPILRVRIMTTGKTMCQLTTLPITAQFYLLSILSRVLTWPSSILTVKSVVFQATLKGASTTGNYSGSSAYIHKAALMARPYS